MGAGRESAVVGEGSSVARHGSWSVCDRLGSRAAFALVEESEMRCNHVSKVCDRLESFEDGGSAICWWMYALGFPFDEDRMDFVTDTFFCGSLILSRVLLFHHSCLQIEVGRSSVSSQVWASFFDHLQSQVNAFAYNLFYDQNPIRDLT